APRSPTSPPFPAFRAPWRSWFTTISIAPSCGYNAVLIALTVVFRASGRVRWLLRLAQDRPPVARVGYGPRDAERLGAILLQTLRVSRRRAFRTGRPVAGIDRRQPSASQVSGTAPRPSRLSCPLPAVRSTPYPPRADARDYAPAQMTGHKFFEIGRRGAAALGVAKMNACRLGGSRLGQSPPTPALLSSLRSLSAPPAPFERS